MKIYTCIVGLGKAKKVKYALFIHVTDKQMNETCKSLQLVTQITVIVKFRLYLQWWIVRRKYYHIVSMKRGLPPPPPQST